MNPDINSIENSDDPDWLASEEASSSGSTLFSKAPVHNAYRILKTDVFNFLQTYPGTSK